MNDDKLHSGLELLTAQDKGRLLDLDEFLGWIINNSTPCLIMHPNKVINFQTEVRHRRQESAGTPSQPHLARKKVTSQH